MEHHPGHLVAGNAELALQLERRQPGRMRGDEVRGPEPEGQRCARTMQHRPPGDGGLMPTGLALPEPSPRELKRLGVLAAWTVVPLWPSTLGQVPTAGSLVAEPRLKVGQRPRKVRPSHTPTLPVGAFGVNRISMSYVIQSDRNLGLRPWRRLRCARKPSTCLERRLLRNPPIPHRYGDGDALGQCPRVPQREALGPAAELLRRVQRVRGQEVGGVEARGVLEGAASEAPAVLDRLALQFSPRAHVGGVVTCPKETRSPMLSVALLVHLT